MRRHWLPRNVSMASRGVPHHAVSASLRTEGERSRGSENMLRYGTSGCPVRALRSAAGRRVHWKSRRYLRLVFLIFGVKGGRHWRLCQFFWREQAARGRANRRTQIDATDRPGARVQGSRRDGSSRTLPSYMHAARRARRLGKRLLRKLTARTSLLRGVRRGGRRVLPRHGYRPVLGVVLGDLVDRVL